MPNPIDPMREGAAGERLAGVNRYTAAWSTAAYLELIERQLTRIADALEQAPARVVAQPLVLAVADAEVLTPQFLDEIAEGIRFAWRTAEEKR